MKTTITLLALLVTLMTYGQTVKDRAYSAKLSTLLSHTVPEISVTDVDQKADIVFIDARETNEYKVAHIKDAICVGYNQLDLSAVESIDKTKKIIVYCSVGYRSEKVAEKLIAKGYQDVSNLYGGIFEWKNNDLPLYDSKGTLTDKVHAYDKDWGQWLKNGKKCYK